MDIYDCTKSDCKGHFKMSSRSSSKRKKKILPVIHKQGFYYGKQTVKTSFQWSFNPLTPMSDQDRISPYNINTISSRQVMRINKNIN